MDSKNKVPKRPHVADGIEEYDNPLPEWWVWLFVGTIVFAVGYLVYYHFGSGTSLREEYAMGVQRPDEGQSGGDRGSSGTVKPTLDEVMQDSGSVAAGQVLFGQNCTPCHGDRGQGIIGPNLTDNAWIHGGSPEAIHRTIAEGVPAKGMVSWLPVVGELKVMQLTAYVVSLRGTSPPNPKAPEGNAE